MSLRSAPPAPPATDEQTKFSLIVIAGDMDPKLAGRMVDGVLYVRHDAPLETQIWAIEQAIRSVTERPYVYSGPKLSAVTS